MSRKHAGSLHDETLQRLCFVCAERLSEEKHRSYNVVDYLPLLSRVLQEQEPSLFSRPGVTPVHFCHKCKSKLNHYDEGRNTTTDLVLRKWAVCGPGCESCSKLAKRAQGGRKKKVSVLIFIFHVVVFSNTRFFYKKLIEGF